jgi:alkylation response protein AidB-like acyl-CoA dehydrogenase
MTLEGRLRHLQRDGRLDLPLPGKGETVTRHRRLFDIGREDLSLARLAEAHVDALAILAEAGRRPDPNALYGVWAAETSDQPLRLERTLSGLELTGSKAFCTGAGLLDRALITVSGPDHRMVDIDLRAITGALSVDRTEWRASAFSETQTATVNFRRIAVAEQDVIQDSGWYLDRPGFWHGACGPASCWAGGAVGLVDYACSQSRSDPHTLAHLGALHADAWSLRAYLDSAGREIDEDPANPGSARIRALTLRHLVEQACTDVLRRFARTYGPRPLVFDRDISRRYQELDLYVRQSHAERDLEKLGRDVLRAGGFSGRAEDCSYAAVSKACS